ncbi:hypothetical protein MBLNU13_g03706t1 [Cladosporium sp. NU13]
MPPTKMPGSTPVKRKAPPTKTAARKRSSYMGITGQSKKTPAEAMASASFADFSFEVAVTLIVGRSEQKMLAYSSHLIRDSQFFAAAMKKEWVEGQTRTIKLPEEDPATIAHYLSYLYTGKMFTEEITATVSDGIESCFRLLSSLYVSGERFIDPKFQNLVLKEIIRLTRLPDKDRMHWYPTGEDVNIIYRGTPQGSPGRRLMVDLHVIMGVKEWMDNELEVEFVTDVAKSLYEKVSGLGFREQDLNIDAYMR